MPRLGQFKRRHEGSSTRSIEEFYPRRVKRARLAVNSHAEQKKISRKSLTTLDRPVAITADPSQLWRPKNQLVVEFSAARTTASQNGKKRTQLSIPDLLRKEKREKFVNAKSLPRVIVFSDQLDANPHDQKRLPSVVASKLKSRSLDVAPKDSINSIEPLKVLSAALPLRPPSAVGSIGRSGPKPDNVVVRCTDLASCRIATSGAELIIYDRTMLPNHFQRLLDVFEGIESAVPLTRLRRISSDFVTVAKIVARTRRRTLTLRHLAQLTHIIPEVIKVQSFRSQNDSKEKKKNFLIQLCDIPEVIHASPAEKKTTHEYAAGARGRRRLLHQRLLEKVRKCHQDFLAKNNILNYQSNIWHPSFELNNVQELPTPELCVSKPQDSTSRSTKEEAAPPPVSSVSANAHAQNILSHEQCQHLTLSTFKHHTKGNTDNLPPKQAGGSTNEAGRAHQEGSTFVSRDLLERVRSRAAAKALRQVNRSDAALAGRALVSRLPKTLDAVRSIMHAERRSAIPWTSLLRKLACCHKARWNEEELERQLNAIVLLVPAYCSKTRLSSKPRGIEYAFRVKSNKAFQSARNLISGSPEKCVNQLKDIL